ncbi:MAG: hypothetical protein HY914_14665 [Desulfomonile tiedjei]|nr:hypothetical protein [Desulfomonile tiedjei]
MTLEAQIDALIEAGWHVLESNFDEAAFLHWRTRSYECLKALLGPGHTYTEHFEYNMRQSEAATLLSGVGVLAAVQLAGLHGKGIEQRRDGADADRAEGMRAGFLVADLKSA